MDDLESYMLLYEPLSELEIVHDAPRVSATELVPVFDSPLRRLEVSGFDLSASFVEALCQADTLLKDVDLASNQMPFETPAEEQAIIDALVEHAERMGGTRLRLPTDALDFREELEAAELACEFGF